VLEHPIISNVNEEDAIPDSKPSDSIINSNNKNMHVENVVDIGQPIKACFLTNSMTDPTGWWMFEKYDGVRGFWNPHKKAFYSRYGRILPIPQTVLDAMPTNLFLDGELW